MFDLMSNRPAMDDVGKDFTYERYSPYVLPGGPPILARIGVFVSMGVKAPDGQTCFIFGRDIHDDGRFSDPTKCEAVRAFMEQHTANHI